MSTNNQYQAGQLDPQVLADLANQNFSDFQHQPSNLGDPRGNLPSGVASHSFQPNASLDLAAIAQQVLASFQHKVGHDSFAQNPSSLSLGDPRGNLLTGATSHSFQSPTSLDVSAVPQQALGGAQQQADHDALAQNPSSLSLGRSFGAEQFIPNSLLGSLANPGNDPLVNQVFLNEVLVAKTQNTTLDPLLVRKDFPILFERVNGRQLIWFDNAATTQKPQSVIDRISYFYEHENSNIHRAAHELAARATDAYEGAREKVRAFLNAKSVNEIVFARGTTEAINLVSQSWGRQNLKEGDEIILSNLEHHANIVPWQLLAKEKGLRIRVIPVDDDGQLLLDEYQKLFNNRTKLVSFTHVSNALGTITPAKKVIEIAHAAGVKVLLDGAQSISHMRVDLQDLNPDWFVFSGHKVFGPTGIGALYGKEDLLNATQPWQGGGNMIKDVTFEHTQFHDAPGRFEAGTGNIADAVGLGAALDYVNSIGIDLIDQYEHQLLLYATRSLKEVPGIRLIGTAKDKASVLSFVIPGIKTEDIGAALNKEGIAVRSGHHCAQPILRRMGVETTVRPSLAFYNTCQEVDAMIAVLHRIRSQH
ncbi:family 2A encapsulin nanocompartment cargo protein cysteine desulfurase [Polynucleobacter sp. AM-25C3]|uniref:family 2A encapsulin nanocompartment cargo protein cysteine desulfurase n=1 Tax=Polynucleobacter sp. AM-25C3 TaxID=1855569 RepID=UPI001C0E07C1|nr:family 2A encapsulin nanocompartment cargo protein cysteine desulfurase [Polynucleobacter sp. AM-25C3]MBU3601871.1 cysteine desulfurase [Polynucleobacter sp. AM-25C3]